MRPLPCLRRGLPALLVVVLALAPAAAGADSDAAPGAHAQFVRLAWSIDARHPVEQPSVVACRYARAC